MAVSVSYCMDSRAELRVYIRLSNEHVTETHSAPRKRDEPLNDFQAVNGVCCNRLKSCELGNTCAEYLSNRIILCGHGNKFVEICLAFPVLSASSNPPAAGTGDMSHSTDIARMVDVDCNHAMAILYENKCMVKTEMSE